MRLYTSLLLLLISLSVSAQKLKFEENFNNQNNGWLNYKGSSIAFGPQKGTYYMRNTGSQVLNVRTPYFLSTANDFAIRTAFSVKSAATAWNGMYLSADTATYKFLFTGNGDVQISMQGQSGVNKVLFSKSNVKKINPGDVTTNEFSISCKKGELTFKINNAKAGKIDFRPKRVQEMGYQLAGNSSARVESFQSINKPSLRRVTMVNDTTITTISRESLGYEVNTEADESNPVVSPDGKYLFFSSTFRPESVDMNSGNRSADIYYCVKKADGYWSAPIHAGSSINNEYDNQVAAITPDNNSILIKGTYRNRRNGNLFSEQLFVSDKEPDGSWSDPQPLGLVTSYAEGEIKYHSFSLSSNGRVLLLSMKQDGGKGGNDIYVSFSKDGSYFSEPRSIGEQVNTPFDEMCPFLGTDGKTLYFASNGYAGYGKSDIFISHRQDESWENWSAPENAGPAINTPGDDLSFSIDAPGQFAYVATTDGAEGETDIFRIPLPKSLRPEPVALIFGRVVNAQTNEPVITSVEGSELPKNTNKVSAVASPRDGSYALTLQVGKKYEFSTNEKGYYAVSERIDLSPKTEFSKIERNIYLFPIKTGQILRVNSRFFNPGTSELNPEAYPELEKMTELVNQNPGLKMTVDGNYDKQMRKDRERTVAFYLYSQGMNPNSILVKAKK